MIQNKITRSIPLFGALVVALVGLALPSYGRPLNVVTTLPDYADLTRQIGGKYVQVKAIVGGEQDAHFVRPKPSFVSMLRDADMLIATGLDLEMWLPSAVDKSANKRIRSGELGYVSVTAGLHLKERPAAMSRIEGGLHIYGNPHITVCPLNMLVVIENIAIGLSRNDPEHKIEFDANKKALLGRLYQKLYGEELVSLMGGETLVGLHRERKLLAFLKHKSFKGTPLIQRLGGWVKQLAPLRGTKLVTYHKNWKYFLDTFGLEDGGNIEPKPGIPPSPRHLAELRARMTSENTKLVLAASYFDERTTRQLASWVHGEAVMVPYYVGGAPGIDSYISLVDHWVNRICEASAKVGLLKAVNNG